MSCQTAKPFDSPVPTALIFATFAQWAVKRDQQIMEMRKWSCAINRKQVFFSFKTHHIKMNRQTDILPYHTLTSLRLWSFMPFDLSTYLAWFRFLLLQFKIKFFTSMILWQTQKVAINMWNLCQWYYQICFTGCKIGKALLYIYISRFRIF